MTAVRWLAVCLVCCLAGFFIWLVWPSGGAPSTGAGSASASARPQAVDRWALGSFVIPSMQELDGGQQASDAEQARHASPEAFVARERSRTEFAHLGAVDAARVAREAFPALIEKHDGGVPALPAGEKLRRFSTENVAQISLPNHERGVVESIEPMALRTASGRFEPINLALKDEGAAFTPAASQVAVQIPKHLGEGVRASGSGVSLTPADGKGEALGGSEGSVDGASVLYANTQADTDTLAKPTSRGFELSAILRSEVSPHQLHYRLGLPGGASLVQHQHGPAQVVKGGLTIGMVMPPSAVDAAGTPVPVTMSVNGNLLTVKMQDVSGEYQYPLQVDPEYVTGRDRSLTGGVWPVEHPKEGETNWVPIFSSAFSIEHTYKKQYGLGGNPEWYEQSWYIEPNREYNAGEAAGLRYRTQGESTIYNLEMWVEGENEPSQTATAVEYRYGALEEGVDNHVTLSEGIHQTRYEDKPLSMTSGYFNNPLETPRENDVRLMDYTTKHESLYGFWTWIYGAQVYVAQEESKHPEVESTSACPQCGFNKSSPTITEAGGRTNVLYGSGSWLSPYQGAFEATAHDPGIGVSFAGFTGAVGYHPVWIRNEKGKCLGIQCPETFSDWMIYNSSMPNGEDETEFFAEDAAGLFADAYAYPRIKVDASKPYNLGFTGMPEEGAEISAAPHKLTVHATDGKKPTPSSGIKSISVSIDGGTPSELSGVSCPEGECTASGAYTLDGESLSEGVHRLVVSAVSNSGEPEAKEFSFDVRHASPVSVGPGSVDPTTGQLTLTASDVSLGGASGVSRSYQSRNLTSGASGPLGPQWAMSVGGGEDLFVLPTGSVSIVSGNGGRTTFSLNSKSEFESPKGDENLKVEYKSTEHKYVLKDETAGTETVFEQPSGTQSTPPSYGGSFGAEAGVLNRPVSDALDGGGNVWVTDWTDDRIAKFTSKGTLVGTYGFQGSESGQFSLPFGIAVNQSTGNVYVSDYGNSRIAEFSSSGSFIRAFGWGVSNGEGALQTCTSSCKAGIAGSGAGQLDGPTGVSVDSSGNVWVAEYGTNRVQKFSETGGYITQFGSAGTGAGQFEAPTDIAFAGGNVYITDQTNNRIDEFSTAGAFIKTIGWGVSNGEEQLETCTTSCRAGIAGTGNGQFNNPRGLTTDPVSGNLYVTDEVNERVQVISTSGTFVSKFGSSGAGPGQFALPMGVAVASTGTIYVTDFENSRVQEWSHAVWWPTSAKGSLSKSTTYLYQSVTGSEGTSIQPSEVLSPTPTGVSCGTKTEELKEEKDKGCHALTFKYATETTAKGENKNEWGEYKGHLSQVIFHAWNPSTKTMEEKAVAQYSDDKQGRLRAEWDPRISPALKTTYGYDTEGHVTALTPPGQESWALTYGTIAGDSSTGRSLKVTRAPASAGLWGGELPHNTEVPKLSGSPAVGVRMGVSNGTWSNSPVVYAYQWEDCNSKGEACTPILGATNANYTPVTGDVGHTLVAQVTATNGGGSVLASSAASTTVLSKAGAFTQTVDSGNSVNAVSCIAGTTDCVLSDSKGAAFYATNVSVTSGATWKSWSGPSGVSPSQAADCPTSSLCLLADGKGTAGGNMYYATSLGGTWTAAFEPSYGVDAISCASSSFCIDGQGESGGYIRYSTNPGSTSWTAEDIGGSTSIKGVFCLSSSFCTAVDSVGDVYVATSTTQIESATWTKTNVDGTSALNGVACTTTASCVAVDGAGNALKLTIESGGKATVSKHNIDGTNSLTAVTCTGSSICVAVDNAGSVFVSKNSGETWTTEYALGDKLTSVSCASTSLCATVDTTGNVTAFNPAGGTGTEGEYHAPQPGSTIEYRVPVSGSGAPYNLNPEEVEKWGQKDKNEYENNDPAEATEIFPPDEPQGWPASGYKRATIDYMNAKGLTVNTATPSTASVGAISTTEYNELNETIRTLSADNRAAAMNEGCKSVSKKECKSAEVSEKLDTKTEYNPEGSEIVKVLGPEHKVKLSTGEEVQARQVTHDYYDEGSKEAEEKFKESYNLVTKNTSGALLSSGEEKDKRETVTSYSGQGDLGWKLRKPTSTTLDPAGLDLVHKTVYEGNAETSNGNVIETRAPAGNSEQVSAPSFSFHFGAAGSGNGQLKEPWAIGLDASENVWAVDTGNNRIEKFSSTGSFVAAYGKGGTGNTEFKEPLGVAVNRTTGNVYVSDSQNNRIEELSSSGGFVEVIGWGVSDGKAELEVCKVSCKAGITGAGNGQFSELTGLTIDSHGDLWLADKGNNRVQEISESGAYMSQFGSKGSGNGQFNEPTTLTISEGSLYVVDRANDRVEQFSMTGSYIGQFGSKGSGSGQFKKPIGIATNPSTGVLYVCDYENNRMEEFSTAGKFLTEWGTWGSTHKQSSPVGVALGATGRLYIIDPWATEVGAWIPPEAGGAHLSYSTQFGSKGSGNGQFTEPIEAAIDGHSNVWATDYYNNRIEKFSSQGSFIATYGKEGSGNGQFYHPAGIDINQSTGNVYIADSGNNRIEELNSSAEFVTAFGTSGEGALSDPGGLKIDSAGNVWVPDIHHDRIVEFSSTGTFIAAYGKEGSGEDQFNHPIGIAFSGENVYVTDSYNHRVEELTNKGIYVRAFGFEGNGSGEFWDPEGINADAAGNLYVVDLNADHVEEFSPSGAFKATFAAPGSGEGQLTHPVSDVIDPAGDLYIVDSGNNRIEKWDSNYQAAHDTKTIYYTAKEEATIAICRNHPEWAGLPCQTEPAAQPDHGLPELPIITISSYNMWGEAEVTEEKFGTGSKAVIRTKTETYDPAGRALTSEEKASPATGTALPKVTDEYNAETGAVEKQSTSEGTITSKDNKLGQLTEYTDAAGNVAKYAYEEGSDGRLTEVSEGKGEEAKSTQAYVYSTTTGFREKLIDSAAGTFTASYDVEGNMTGETYPNNMTATYTINSIRQTTSLVYEKNTNCATKCPETWFSDSVMPSIHGETLQQTSTLSKENYAYDTVGHLLETQETPAGKGCVTRLYGYDEESNRTSLTTREPGTEGKCATEGGTNERHTYDEANRLTDENVTYETFGNTTKMPSGDAGGHEIVSTYYVDNQLATQEQNGEKSEYLYDPAGRTRETLSKGTTNATVITHYAGSGSALTWTSEGTEKWARNIPGIDGSLCATQEAGKAPVLQVHDLQGNIVGAAADSESETKLLPGSYNSTEFGVPNEGKTPPKYAWLGAVGVSTETSFGSGVATQGGASYVPQVARALQTAPVVPPGAFPNGSPGTQFTAAPVTAGAIAGAQEIATQFWQTAEAERQKAKEEEAAAALQKCREEGGCGAEGEPVDPQVRYMLSAWGTKLLVHALTVGGAAAGQLLGKWFGPEAGVVGQLISTFSGEAVAGLNECLTAYYNSGQPKGYRCGVRLEWWDLPGPPYILPISAEFEDCFYDAKKKSKYDCYTAYSISWGNLF